MTDLLQVLADFSTAPFSHLLPSLDRALVTTSDLLTLDAVDIAKRAQLPPADVGKLADAILLALQKDLGVRGQDEDERQPKEIETTALNSELAETRAWQTISTLDSILDATLGGGIPTGYISEITGESGAGKTQFLLTLLLASQLPPPHGLSRPALYISTEAALSTSRLSQLLRQNAILSCLPENEKPTLNNIFSIQTPDLESQDHILRYQVPVAIARQNIGLIVIDSIASNYRAEFERPIAGNGAKPNRTNSQGAPNPERRQGQAMADRKVQLVTLGSFLRNLARTENIAIVVANQVADRFSPNPIILPQPVSSTSALQPPPSTPMITLDPLTLDHQQRWFTGWGDAHPPSGQQTNFKTPSLGLVWANQISARIALIKEANAGNDNQKRKRWLRVVFAPWVGATRDGGVEYEIVAEGVKAVVKAQEDSNQVKIQL